LSNRLRELVRGIVALTVVSLLIAFAAARNGARVGSGETTRSDASPAALGTAETTRSDASPAALEPRTVERPSFDCALAKKAAARLICADAELARLDDELGAAFRGRKAHISASQQPQFVADQRAWIRDRNTRCDLDGKSNATIEGLASSKPCMVSAIRERIAFLAQFGSAGAASPQEPLTPQRQSAALSPSGSGERITDKKGEPAGVIQLDTLQVNPDGKGSVTACHKSEHGPACNLWTFDCNYLADGQFAHSNYFPAFMQRQNGPPHTPEQNAELDALDAIATKLPAAACRRFGRVTQNPKWLEVRGGTGEVKATIDVATIIHDANGDAHAIVCVNTESDTACPAGKIVLRWYFNCRTHQYSWIDTSVMPGFRPKWTMLSPTLSPTSSRRLLASKLD